MATREPRVLIVGAGVGGIALACKLQMQLDFENYMIYDRNASVGGTWYMSTYPGVGCDIESHFYSFSFNRKPDWEKMFASGGEILEYIRDTAEKFGVTDHVQLNTEVCSAHWVEEDQVWRVHLKNIKTGVEFMREAEVFISAAGVFGRPRDCDVEGCESFRGKIVHTAEWDWSLDLQDKDIAVIGNGCSAAQLVPSLVPLARTLVQFQRSPQYYFERPNRRFTGIEKFLFRYAPFYDLWYRYNIYRDADAFHASFMSDSETQIRQREILQQRSLDYMYRTAPKKYHDILTPDFPAGCKRRIFDPGYLECLHDDRVTLTNDRVARITEDSIVTKSGQEYKVDVICLATGYKVQEFLQPMEIYGKKGKSLQTHWQETGGAQAYKSTYISNFPNLGLLFGPNSFPSNSSVIFTNEVTADYIIKTMIKPILRGHFRSIEVKESAEMVDSSYTQKRLSNSVWSENCTNWNLNSNGKNTTNYYDYACNFWYSRVKPRWKDFNINGGSVHDILIPPMATALGTAFLTSSIAAFYYLK
ncbi:hypothetical protein TRICI_003941 [Trichomonascus ciferrii]|uniref:Uncharacterized protein n=1 Tax=Trichomonascus ciferrii TaxID=44093 RepID=A0A642V2B3_9ASCO|nr:hypothetical protein TRICI_003941 [Trichomonascus ciferrii]